MSMRFVIFITVCVIFTGNIYGDDDLKKELENQPLPKPQALLDEDRIPRIRGEEFSPCIIFFKDHACGPLTAPIIPEDSSIEVSIAIWRDGRVVWSYPDSPHINDYYETYLSDKELDDFWNKYLEIKSWDHYGDGHGYIDSSVCKIMVSAKQWRLSTLSSFDPRRGMMDTVMYAPEFDWPHLKEYYTRSAANADFVETWLRLRHNIMMLIPYRPKEIRNKEKINVEFYIP